MAIADPNGTVLVGFAEALAGPEAVWSLLRAGWSVTAFTRCAARSALRRDRRVQLVEVPAPEVSATACREAVRRLTLTPELVAVLPLDDAAVWLTADLAADLLVPVAGPSGAQARLALDKRLQLRAAADAGFAVPPWSEEVAPEFPVVVKPALAAVEVNGRLVRGGMVVCHDQRQLDDVLRVPSVTGPRLVQHLVRGVGEGIFGIVRGNTLLQVSAHQRVRMMNPAGSGSSACRPIPVDAGPATAMQSMLTAHGWSGIAMVELLRDSSGAAWFMEVNGRTWGSTALARRLGLEYPAWAVSHALGRDWSGPAAPSDEQEFLCRHLGRELVHLLAVLRGPRNGSSQIWPGRLSTVAAVSKIRRSDHWYNAERPAVLLADTLGTLRSQLRRQHP